MSRESKLMAGILLLTLPTVMFGGTSLLTFLINDPSYIKNALRQDLWRAGHAHAGVLLILSLIVLRYVDDTSLSDKMKWFVRVAVPSAAIFLPIAFFFSVLSPTASQPNGIIYLAYFGAVILAAGVLTLAIGLIKGARKNTNA